jgi:guanylate kinase
MSGKLVLIGGLSGSGKTTLMRVAAAGVPGLEILQTTTTRPMRDGEVQGREYVFVTDEQYEALRAASPAWDHLEYHGHKYGADAAAVRGKLGRGVNIICTITPNPDEIKLLEKAYGVRAITIWLDVPKAVAHGRISADKHRAARQETNAAQVHFGHLFKPAGVLAQDEAAFVAFVRQLLGDGERS